MNKNLIKWAITVLCVILAVILVFVVTNIDKDKSGGNIITGFFTPDEEKTSDNKSENIPESEEDWADPVIGEDDGFEGSDVPAQSHSSAESNSSVSTSSSEGSSSNSNNAPSINSSSKPSGGSSSSGSSSGSSEAPKALGFEEYIAMSGEEQKKYMESFSSVEAFFAWYNDAKAKYDEENAGIEIDGEINLGDYINP